MNLEPHPKIGIVLGFNTELRFGVLACEDTEHAFSSDIQFKEGDRVSFFINKHFEFRAENVRLLKE